MAMGQPTSDPERRRQLGYIPNTSPRRKRKPDGTAGRATTTVLSNVA